MAYVTHLAVLDPEIKPFERPIFPTKYVINPHEVDKRNPPLAKYPAFHWGCDGVSGLLLVFFDPASRPAPPIPWGSNLNGFEFNRARAQMAVENTGGGKSLRCQKWQIFNVFCEIWLDVSGL